MVAFNSESLSKLCSADQLELLNSIDRLRLQGINNYVSLPQIIVCGDQSSGKSSVLEAISGVSFPKSSSLCTRFPTELVLRRGSHVSANISIVPHASRGESEDKALRGFKESLTDFGDLPKIIESAKLAMGLSTLGKAFSNDILRIELTSPDHPHLTIVDLPGLIHSETKHQSASDVELIQEIVQGYMTEPRCVILAVISAKNDFANQVVLKLARSADKTGNRTLGVITKPDTLKPGSQSEADFVSLARNQHVEFRLGWHVLKNMDSEQGAATLRERDAEEATFFAQGAWTELPHASLGIQRLRTRLSKVLLRQIASELPSLLGEIDDKFVACQSQLMKLGKPRVTLDEQRLYLFSFVEQFQNLVKSAVDGTYNHPFFVDAKLEKGYQQRIRAVVQNLNDEFSSEMQQRGHYRKIVTDHDQDTDDEGPLNITRKLFVEHIQHLLHRTRGRELPGIFNSMIVANLFLEQSRPWERIVNDHVQKVWTAANSFLRLVSAHLADGDTYKAMQQEVFGPAMEAILSEMKIKTAEILAPHKSGHPITYDDSFIQELQSVRRQRLEEATSKTVLKFFGLKDAADALRSYQFNVGQLITNLVASNEPNVNRAAAEDALDCLNAYYKVALKRFIDDVAVEVVEAKLIAKLNKILSPVGIFSMSEEQVSRLAGESEDNRAQREELTRQLAVLRAGLETCKRFVGLKISGEPVFVSGQEDPFSVDNCTSAPEGKRQKSASRSSATWECSSQSSLVSTPISEPLRQTMSGPVEKPEPVKEPEPVPEPKPVVVVELSDVSFGTSMPKKGKKGKRKKDKISLNPPEPEPAPEPAPDSEPYGY